MFGMFSHIYCKFQLPYLNIYRQGIFTSNVYRLKPLNLCMFYNYYLILQSMLSTKHCIICIGHPKNIFHHYKFNSQILTLLSRLRMSYHMPCNCQYFVRDIFHPSKRHNQNLEALSMFGMFSHIYCKFQLPYLNIYRRGIFTSIVYRLKSWNLRMTSNQCLVLQSKLNTIHHISRSGHFLDTIHPDKKYNQNLTALSKFYNLNDNLSIN